MHLNFVVSWPSSSFDNVIVPMASCNQEDKGLVIQTLLFVAGINTLLQALFGTRLPTVIGGSFAYVIPIAYIISDTPLQQITDHHEVSLLIFFLLFVWIILQNNEIKKLIKLVYMIFSFCRKYTWYMNNQRTNKGWIYMLNVWKHLST